MTDTRAEDLFLKVLDLVGAAYWVYDVKREELAISEKSYTILGYTEGTHLRKTTDWFDLVHPEETERVIEWFRQTYQPGVESHPLECRLRTAAGGWRWIQVRARGFDPDDDGVPAQVVGTSMDITQKKLLEQALNDAEVRWTSLVDEAPVGISIIGADGQIQFLNRFEADRHGASVLGKNWKDFLPADLHPVVDLVLSNENQPQGPTVFETYRNNDADGTLVYYENHLSPLHRQGEARSTLVISLDVTAERRTRRQQTKARDRMEVLLSLHDHRETNQEALFLMAAKTAAKLTDSTVGFLFLRSRDQSQFNLCFSYQFDPTGESVHPNPGEPVLRLVEESVRQRHFVIQEHPSSADPAHQRRNLAVPVLRQGLIVAVLVVQNKNQIYDEDDVTELVVFADNFWQLIGRKEAEETLTRLYQAVEHSPVSIVITDPHGLIEYRNHRFDETTGYSADEASGRNLWTYLATQTPYETYESLRRTVRQGQEWRGEIAWKRRDGAEIAEWVSVSPVLDATRKVTHFITVIEDVTERKLTQEMLTQAQRMETVGQLAAGVAHDFNNLLTSILAYNEMLLRKTEPESFLRTCAERIEVAGQRASSLVSGLLAVGSRQRLAKVILDLGTFLKEEETLISSLVKGLFHLVPPTDASPIPVEIDPGQISQVVANLVTNARDAMERVGTQIVLTYGKTEGHTDNQAWFSVEDDGPGIPEETLERIFEPFFTTKAIGKGTGLGLSIVQGIIHQHQGFIKVVSSLGRGTKFTVFLPLAEDVSQGSLL